MWNIPGKIPFGFFGFHERPSKPFGQSHVSIPLPVAHKANATSGSYMIFCIKMSCYHGCKPLIYIGHWYLGNPLLLSFSRFIPFCTRIRIAQELDFPWLPCSTHTTAYLFTQNRCRDYCRMILSPILLKYSLRLQGTTNYQNQKSQS